KRMGAEFIDEVVVSVRPDVQKIWVRMRADDHSISFGVAKDAGQESAPTVWMEVGERFAVSDFFYSGFVLLPGPNTSALESAKFSNIGLQPVGGSSVSSGGSASGPIAGRGFWGRMARRIGNIGSEIASAVGDAYDWSVDVAGDALGVCYRVVVKRIAVPVIIYAFDNTFGELIRVFNRGFGTRLPPYESIDEGFHPAKVLSDIKLHKIRPNDPVDLVLKKQLEGLARKGSELSIDGRIGEWEKISNSLANLKLYMADYLDAEMNGTRAKFSAENYKLYTGFELEKLYTRTSNMLQYCYDAKTPDVFDVFVVTWLNDAYDCEKATSRFSTSFDRFS
ncbi:MAG TPA: hypothetical protein PLU50_12625, partial [Pseudobdellovibrionaceae bacterium]|nr:hypothetical protein [Pseudobdellovibrionaceae bacterium]